jgi:hypothetical protein
VVLKRYHHYDDTILSHTYKDLFRYSVSGASCPASQDMPSPVNTRNVSSHSTHQSKSLASVVQPFKQ